MLSFAGSLKVFVGLEPQDMRKSFNTLSILVREHLGREPDDGALYVFSNKRRNLVKILFWDGTGLWVAAKRLEQGRFSWPKPSKSGQARLQLTPEALCMLTDGIDLRGAQLKGWYER
jgi:transposase